MELNAQVERLSDELEKVIEDYNKTGEQLKAARTAVDALNTRLAPLESKVEGARKQVGLMASAIYQRAGMSPTAILLTSESPMGFVSQLETLNHFAHGRQKEIIDFEIAKTEFDDERAKLDGALQEQVNHEKDLAAKKAKIQDDLNGLKAQRVKAGITSSVSPRLPAPGLPGTAGRAVDFAYGTVGANYVFGGEGPGYDCSGLTLMAWRSAGVSLPHNAASQFNATARIGRGELEPGDLVFSNGLGHVALYVGNDQVIHAPQPGQRVTRTSINQIGGLYGYGRVHS